MELKDTIKMMKSNDYKERVRAEYYQLDIRIRKLKSAIISHNEKGFYPTLDVDVCTKQLNAMIEYQNCLEIRAKVDGIDL